MQYLETLLHRVPRYRIWTRAGYAVPRDTVTPGTKVKNLDHEGGYAVPRDTVTPGIKVKNLNHEGGYAVPRDTVTPGIKVRKIFEVRTCVNSVLNHQLV